MSNYIASVKEIARNALPRLIENLVFPNLIHRDYSGDFVSGKGAVIQVRKPVMLTAEEFDASSGVTASDVKENTVDVALDRLATVDVEFSAIESATSVDDINRLFIEPAAAALAAKINSDGLGLYADVSNVVTLGDNGYGLDTFANAAKVLNDNNAPMTERYGVWSPAANAAYQQIPALINAEKAGTTEALRVGSIGRVFGLDNYMTQSIKTHTPGTAASGEIAMTLGSTALKGANSIKLRAASACTLKAGDVITIDDISYTIKTDVSVTTSAAEVLIVGEVKKAATSGTSVTAVKAGGAQNIVFNKNAFAFVTRPLAAPAGVESYTTSYNGISLRVCRGYDMRYKKDMLSMDVLYGYKAVYPELAVRVIG